MPNESPPSSTKSAAAAGEKSGRGVHTPTPGFERKGMTCGFNAALAMLLHVSSLKALLPSSTNELQRCLETRKWTDVHELIKACSPDLHKFTVQQNDGSRIDSILTHLSKFDTMCNSAFAVDGSLEWQRAKSCRTHVQCNDQGTSPCRFISLAINHLEDRHGASTSRGLDLRIVNPPSNTCGNPAKPISVTSTDNSDVWVALTHWDGMRNFTGNVPPNACVVGAIVLNNGHFTYWQRIPPTWCIIDDDKPLAETTHDPPWSKVMVVVFRLLRDPEKGGGTPPRTPRRQADNQPSTNSHNIAKSTPDGHRIATVNVRNGFSYKCHKEFILQELEGRRGMDIIAVSEWGQPIANDLTKLAMAGWTVVETTRHERTTTRTSAETRGGAALLFRTAKYKVEALTVAGHLNCQVACARAQSTARKTAPWETFASIYVAPVDKDDDEPPLATIIDSIIVAAGTSDAPLCAILGDVNARHTSWDSAAHTGDNRNWSRGQTLAEAINKWDLHVAALPTLPRQKSEVVTAIDIIITALPVNEQTLATVRFDRIYTDHYALTATIGDEAPASVPLQWIHAWSWGQFNLTTSEQQKTFSDRLDERIGVYGVGNLPVGTRHCLLSNAVESALVGNGAKRRWIKASYGTKRAPEDDSLSLLKFGPWAVAKALREAHSGPPPPIVRSQSDITPLMGKKQADFFVNHFASTHRARPLQEVTGLPALVSQARKLTANIQIHPDLVRMALQHQRKTAGKDEDGLDPLILEVCALSSRFVNALTRLLEDIVACGEAPHSWKRLLVVPLSKKDKFRGIAENYRAIFITRWLSRVGETLFSWRLKAELARVSQPTQPHGYHNCQLGFRSGLGDTVVSLATAELLSVAHEKKEMLFQALVDLDGAFPHVHEPDALHELQLAGASTANVAFATALGGRCTFTAVAGQYRSDPVVVDGGEKAGRVLAPMKWGVYTRPILERLNRAVHDATRKPGQIGYAITTGIVLAAADDFSILAVSGVEGIKTLILKLNEAFTELAMRFAVEVSKKSTAVLHNVKEFVAASTQTHQKTTLEALKTRLTSMTLATVNIPIKGISNNATEHACNLGITWTVGTANVFKDHVQNLLAKHGNGLRLVMPFTSKLPLPRLMELYNAYCIGPWIHSMPIIIGLASTESLDQLDQCQAQALKGLAAITSSAHNYATIYELGSRSFACLAMGRVVALREQLVRINAQATSTGDPIPAVQLSLKYLTRTYSKWQVELPAPPRRQPAIWDAPQIEVSKMHHFSQITFLGDHELTKAEKATLANEGQSDEAKLIKREANVRRLNGLTQFAPAVWGYGDGSVKITNNSGQKTTRAATAANLYENDEADPTFQYRKAAPGNSSSFTAEMKSVSALSRMANACQPPTGCTTAIFIIDSLSKVKQLAKGPIRTNDASAAEDLTLLFNLLATKKFTKVVIAHLYSHTAADARMDQVDVDAKAAAANATEEQIADAPHWWKDDARTVLQPWLQKRANALLQDTIRGKYGPTGPTIWGKATRGLYNAQLRRLAQVRVGCCSGLGGHLHGLVHAAKCGLCGKEVGRSLKHEQRIQSPIEHLLTCTMLQDLRTEIDVKSMQALWSKDPKTVLRFLDQATEKSRAGPHRRADETLGAEWASKEE